MLRTKWVRASEGLKKSKNYFGALYGIILNSPFNFANLAGMTTAANFLIIR